MPYRVTAFDWVLFAGLVVAWGSSFAMSKVALQHFTPEWIAAMRLVVGAVVLAVATLFQSHSLSRTTRDLGIYAWLGFVGNAAPFFVITWGMQFITSGVAGLLMGTIPLIIIVMAHFTLPGERLNTFRSIGFAIGFVGIVVLVGPGNLLNIKAQGQELIGQLAVMSGCIMYGINAISTKRFNLPGTIPVSAAVLAAGAVLATINAAAQSPLPAPPFALSSALAVLGLGLIPTGLATVLWFKAVERTSPTFTSMSNYLVPVYALIFGALTLGESIGLNVIAALALIIVGIYISRMKAKAA
jgi:drug/metabolite transporter (DMT)-like permease